MFKIALFTGAAVGALVYKDLVVFVPGVLGRSPCKSISEAVFSGTLTVLLLSFLLLGCVSDRMGCSPACIDILMFGCMMM